MGGLMCIHGYAGEYPIFFDEIFILDDEAINLALIRIKTCLGA
jgi:hypothetical protein